MKIEVFYSKKIGLTLLQATLLTSGISAGNLTLSEYAHAAESPAELGGGGTRGRIAPTNSPVKVSERADNKTQKKKGPLSEREKREAKGNRLNRGELETVGLEKQLGGALDKEIVYTEKLLPKMPSNSDQRAEILRRLIENYHQKAALTFFNESRTYDRNWANWDKAGRQGSEPVLSTSTSKLWTSKVIQRAQQMITEFPKHRRVDEAYFQIAFALDSVGQRKEGASYYSQVVAKFPNSKRVADAHFALGEYYFEGQDFKKAITSFSEVTRFTRSPIFPFAVYKIAWCQYNMQQFRPSLGSFQNVVRLSGSSGEMGPGAKIRLKDEALRDMVLVWAEIGDLDGAERYFSEHGGEKHYADLLLRLADILRERGQYDQSVRVLKRFIARSPNDVKAPEIQIQIVDISALKADKALLWAELKILLANYGPDSAWAKTNAALPNFKELQDRIHAVSITYAKKMHASAQKDNAKYFYSQAEIGYNLYLTFFPARPESAEVRYYLGEIQYGQNRYREAVKTFWAITQQKQKSPQFAKSTEYLLSSAYYVVEPALKEIRKRKAVQTGAPRGLAPELTEYIKVCDAYVGWFPKAKAVLDCHVDVAEIYLKNQNFAEAEKRLLAIAKDYSTQKEGKVAAELLLWLSASDKKKLIATTEELIKIPAYTQGDLGNRLRIIKETFKFELIGQMEKGGKHLDAAREYEKLGTQSPNSKDADKAWFNAGVNYKKAGEGDKAVAAFTKVYGTYAKSPQAPEALLAIIEISESRLQLDKAAQMSFEFVGRFPKDKRVTTISRETCYLYDALDDVQKASQLCGQVVKLGGKDGTDAAKTLADLYERKGRYKEFIDIVDSTILKLPLSASEKIDYLARAGDAERKMGRAGNAQRREQQISGIFSSNAKSVQGVALAAVGRVEFEKQLPVLQKYKGVRLTAVKKDASDLQASIQAKLKSLDQVEKAFLKVLATGDSEWGVAALYTIGQSFEAFAHDLKNPPLPPGVSAADMQKLKEILAANFAKPAADKAKKFYTEAAGAVSKFGVYTDYSERTAAALARVNPAEYRHVDEYIPEAVYVGTQLMDVGKVHGAIEALGAKE